MHGACNRAAPASSARSLVSRDALDVNLAKSDALGRMPGELPPSTPSPVLAQRAPGHASLRFRRCGQKTVLAAALARSPLRLLTPRNHGDAAWVFLAGLGGGLVDGDRFDVHVDAEVDTAALIASQASTKIYRSPSGCSQRLVARVADGASLAVLPDPVVCFADARYRQDIDIDLAPRASLVLLDGYTCGRSARGERWQFSRYAARTRVIRSGRPVLVDATVLDPAEGPIAPRMGRFDAILSLFVIGERFAGLREAILTETPAPESGGATLAAASPIGADAAVLRVAATRFENASRVFRPSFRALARLLGDDPFARKW
jgi:urease accessory protein